MIRFTKYESTFKFVQYVILAKAKNDIKPVFNYLYVDGPNIACTNGHCLHTVKFSDKPEDLKDGFYEVIKSNKSEIILEKDNFNGVFPNYEMVLKHDGFDETEITCLSVDKAVAVTIRAIDDDKYMNIKDLTRMLEILNLGRCSLYTKSKCSVVFKATKEKNITEKNITRAAIMPIGKYCKG